MSGFLGSIFGKKSSKKKQQQPPPPPPTSKPTVKKTPPPMPTQTKPTKQEIQQMKKQAKAQQQRQSNKIIQETLKNAAYKPPNLFEGMQLRQVVQPKPPPPNPGIEKSDPLSSSVGGGGGSNATPVTNQYQNKSAFSFLNQKTPVVEEIDPKVIAKQNTQTLFKSFQDNLAMKSHGKQEVKKWQQQEQQVQQQQQQPQPQPQQQQQQQSKPFDPFEGLDFPQYIPSIPSVETSKTDLLNQDIETQQAKVVMMEEKKIEKSNDGNVLKTRGDGVTYQWDIKMLKKKEIKSGSSGQGVRKKRGSTIKQKEIVQQQEVKEIHVVAKTQEPKVQISDTKNQQQQIAQLPSLKQQRSNDRSAPPQQQNKNSDQLIDSSLQAQQLSTKNQSNTFKIDFGKVETLNEINIGIKQYQQKLIKLTLQQHEIEQSMSERKKLIEKKQQMHRLAQEKEKQLVSQQKYEQGERVKQTVDTLQTQILTLTEAFISLESTYNTLEIEKCDWIQQLSDKLQSTEGKFFDKLDYQKDRFQNWKTRQNLKIQAKRQIEQNEENQIEEILSKQKQNQSVLQASEQKLDKKIMETTQSIVAEKQQHESQIGDLDQKIADLQKQMKKLINIRSQLQNKVQKCSLLVEQEKRNFIEEFQEIENIKKSIEENEQLLKKSNTFLTEVRQEITQTLVKIESHSKQSQKVISNLQLEYDQLHQLNNSITSQNILRRNTVMQINSISKEIKTQQKEYIELKKSSQKTRGQILEFENEVDQLKQRTSTISNSISNAENNKKKAASARQFSKAAVIVKELKNLVEQKQNCEKQLEQLIGQMKNKANIVDEQSIKLPQLKLAIEGSDIKLKKQQRSFLGMRLEQLQLLKNILNDDDYGQKETDFKAISVLQEEMVSCEQQLMRIKAHLKSRGFEEVEEEEKKEEIKQQQLQDQEDEDERQVEDVKVAEQDLQLEKEKSEDQGQQQQKEVTEDHVQTEKLTREQIQKKIEDIDEQLEQLEEKIDQFSNSDQFQKAAELQEKQDQVKQEKKLLLDLLASTPQTPDHIVNQNHENEKELQIENHQIDNQEKQNDDEQGQKISIQQETQNIPKYEIQNDMKEEDSFGDDENQKEQNNQQNQNVTQELLEQENNQSVNEPEQDVQPKHDNLIQENNDNAPQQEQNKLQQQLNDEETVQKQEQSKNVEPTNNSSGGFSGGLFSGMEIKS